MLVTVKRDATQSSLFIILQVHSTCFGCQPHPSLRVHKTITTASGTGQLPPSNVVSLATLEGRNWPVPEAVVIVLCTPDDGWGWHPKHVEWTCRIINRLLCITSLGQLLIYIYIYIYRVSQEECAEFGRVFLMFNYSGITQNTYIQSWTVTEIIDREKCGLHRSRRTVRRPWLHTCPMRLPDN